MSDERRWSASAVLIGSLVDIGGSLVVGVIVAAVEGARLIAQGFRQEELTARLYADKGFLVSGMVVGLIFSAVGGFVPARLAKKRELAHGGATAAVCILLSLAMTGSSSGLPGWYFVSYAFVLPAALLGAAVGRARNHR
jgi:uncharacterized BrkB/YihY/UPF0761 family membrane protein